MLRARRGPIGAPTLSHGDRGQVLPVANLSPQIHLTARPLRIEFADAVYHVTSRGDRREAIYRDDEDRQRHLAVIAQAMDRFDAQVLAYCLMGNHVAAHTAPAQSKGCDDSGTNGQYRQRLAAQVSNPSSLAE